jgi:pimeloyl-ACP methyl ester carboxylesterase
VALDRFADGSRDQSDEEPAELSLETPAGRLAGLAWGDPALPPLLALHGWLDNAASFAPLAARIRHRRLVAIDLPGHGRSAHRPSGCLYHFVDYLPVLPAVADAMGWGRFDIAGHSLGAGIASIFSAVFPERIGRLIMIDGIGPLAEEARQQPSRMRRSLERLGRRLDQPGRVHRHIDQLIDARMGAGDLERASANLLVARNVRSVDDGVEWRTDPRLRWPSPLYMSEDQVMAFLSALIVPSLLIIASAGVLAGRATTAPRIAAIHDLRVQRLPGRHHLHMDDPAPVAAVLNDFLAPTGPAAPPGSSATPAS